MPCCTGASPDGYGRLCRALWANTSLKRLHVAGAALSWPAALTLALAARRHHPCLALLDLQASQMPPWGLAVLLRAASCGRGGLRSLNIAGARAVEVLSTPVQLSRGCCHCVRPVDQLCANRPWRTGYACSRLLGMPQTQPSPGRSVVHCAFQSPLTHSAALAVFAELAHHGKRTCGGCPGFPLIQCFQNASALSVAQFAARRRARAWNRCRGISVLYSTAALLLKRPGLGSRARCDCTNTTSSMFVLEVLRPQVKTTAEERHCCPCCLCCTQAAAW